MNRKMLKQAQAMQKKLASAQEELAKEATEISVGGGAVKVRILGNNNIESLEIRPDVIDPEDVEMLQDMIVAAVNEAMTKANEKAEKKLGFMRGIGGMF